MKSSLRQPGAARGKEDFKRRSTGNQASGRQGQPEARKSLILAQAGRGAARGKDILFSAQYSKIYDVHL